VASQRGLLTMVLRPHRVDPVVFDRQMNFVYASAVTSHLLGVPARVSTEESDGAAHPAG
jgi:hypothetical protein